MNSLKKFQTIIDWFQSLGAITFQSVCRTNSIWLHLEGHALAGLSLVGGGEVPSSTPEVTSSSDGSPKTSAAVSEKEPLASGDSLSLTIGSWLGIPALPFVTLYKVKFDKNYIRAQIN